MSYTFCFSLTAMEHSLKQKFIVINLHELVFNKHEQVLNESNRTSIKEFNIQLYEILANFLKFILLLFR
mgnify:CR=1 FL=1